MKHGNGIWRGCKNDSYIGEWKFGKADGYGVHTWTNGFFFFFCVVFNIFCTYFKEIDMKVSLKDA